MADLSAIVLHMFRDDQTGAIDFMLDNFQKIRDYSSKPYVSSLPEQSEVVSTASAPLLDPLFCTQCGSHRHVIHETEGDLCCLDCGTCSRYIDDTIRAVDFEEQVDKIAQQYFAPKKSEYKRMQHFCDLLNQMQDRRDVEIPHDVLLAVQEKMKERCTPPKKPSVRLIRTILKEVGWGYKQYENAQAILNRLTKYDKQYTMEIPHDVERRMKLMFMKIENAWKRISTPNAKASRKSFLSYSYVIKQLLRILDKQDLAECIPTIKSKARIKSHNEAWKCICETCEFVYMPLL